MEQMNLELRQGNCVEFHERDRIHKHPRHSQDDEIRADHGDCNMIDCEHPQTGCREDGRQEKNCDCYCPAYDKAGHEKTIEAETERGKENIGRRPETGNEVKLLLSDNVASAQEKADRRENGDGAYGDYICPALIVACDEAVLLNELAEPLPSTFREIGWQQPYAKEKKQRCGSSEAI